jgi:hypothetical protein
MHPSWLRIIHRYFNDQPIQFNTLVSSVILETTGEPTSFKVSESYAGKRHWFGPRKELALVLPQQEHVQHHLFWTGSHAREEVKIPGPDIWMSSAVHEEAPRSVLLYDTNIRHRRQRNKSIDPKHMSCQHIILLFRPCSLTQRETDDLNWSWMDWVFKLGQQVHPTRQPVVMY